MKAYMWRSGDIEFTTAEIDGALLLFDSVSRLKVLNRKFLKITPGFGPSNSLNKAPSPPLLQ
jgi:hypothetical protein